MYLNESKVICQCISFPAMGCDNLIFNPLVHENNFKLTGDYKIWQPT